MSAFNLSHSRALLGAHEDDDERCISAGEGNFPALSPSLSAVPISSLRSLHPPKMHEEKSAGTTGMQMQPNVP